MRFDPKVVAVVACLVGGTGAGIGVFPFGVSEARAASISEIAGFDASFGSLPGRLFQRAVRSFVRATAARAVAALSSLGWGEETKKAKASEDGAEAHKRPTSSAKPAMAPDPSGTNSSALHR